MTGAELPRHGLWTRLVHWTVAGSFGLLLLTGLPLNAPSLFGLTALFGGGYAARALHPWFGLVFTAALVALAAGWARSMLPEAGDAAWVRALPRYLAHHPDVPETGRFNAAQKAFFWAAVVGGAVLLGSGLMLWWPSWFPAALAPWAAPAHVAVFAALTAGIVHHIYLSTLAFPGTLQAMFRGTVSRAWAWTHHRAWARAVDRRADPSND